LAEIEKCPFGDVYWVGLLFLDRVRLRWSGDRRRAAGPCTNRVQTGRQTRLVLPGLISQGTAARQRYGTSTANAHFTGIEVRHKVRQRYGTGCACRTCRTPFIRVRQVRQPRQLPGAAPAARVACSALAGRPCSSPTKARGSRPALGSRPKTGAPRTTAAPLRPLCPPCAYSCSTVHRISAAARAKLSAIWSNASVAALPCSLAIDLAMSAK
jgi:hypothetical protein